MNVDVKSVRHPSAICCDSWEFRKICSEGSVFPNGFLVADLDGDGTEEYLVGTTEGELLIMMSGKRNALFSATIAGTISVVMFTPSKRTILVVTLEGQCEVRDAPSPQVLGKQPDLRKVSAGDGLEVRCRLTIPANCTCGDLDATGNLLFLGSSDRRVYAYDLVTNVCIGNIFLQSQVFSVRCVSVLSVSLLCIGTTTNLVLLDADSGAVREWNSRKIEVSDDAGGTATEDDDFTAGTLSPLWVFTITRDQDRKSQHESLGEREFNPKYHSQRVVRALDHATEFMRPCGAGKSIRLPVAIDWLTCGEGRVFISFASEDGYVFLFHLYDEGRCIDDKEAEKILVQTRNRDIEGCISTYLCIVPVWRNVPSVRLFRSLTQKISIVSLLNSSLATVLVLLATDGQCFILDTSSRTLLIAQLRPDACAFSVRSRGESLLLVCISVDEIVEYQITPPDIADPAGQEMISWDPEEQALLSETARLLFHSDSVECLRQVEMLCASGLSEKFWALLTASCEERDV